MTEEEVKLNYITPAIENAGWAKKQIRMEYSINAGKIVVRGNVAKRLPKKKADYVFFIKRTFRLLFLLIHVPLNQQEELNFSCITTLGL